MTGKQLLEKIKSYGYRNAELAALLGISEQAFNSKLKTSDIKVSLLEDLARVTNKNVYEWIGSVAPSIDQQHVNWQDKYYSLIEEHANTLKKLAACLEEKEEIKEGSPKVNVPAAKPAQPK